MNETTVSIKVNNMPNPEKLRTYEYLILTFDDASKSFWYYGADNDENKCKEICSNWEGKFYISNPFFKSHTC